MKATKIMGAVLGVLLVAALFTGAVAAVTPTPLDGPTSGDKDVYLGTVYAYGIYSCQNVSLNVNSIWTNANGKTVTFIPSEVANGFYIDGAEVVEEGDYTVYVGGLRYHINVLQPSVAISGSVYKDIVTGDGTSSADILNLTGSLIGSTVMNNKYIVVNNTKIGSKYVAFTNPDGKLTSVDAEKAFHIDVTGKTNLKAVDLGVWTVQAYYVKGQEKAIGGVNLTSNAPDFILGKPYYFTVVSSDSTKKLETLDEEIIQGGYATIQVTAPTGTWDIAVTDGEIPAGQPLVGYDLSTIIGKTGHYNISIGASGVGTFTVTTDNTANIKVELLENVSTATEQKFNVLKSVTVKVKSGAITAEAESASVFIGNEFDVDGTNDLGGTVYFFIKGTNFNFQPIYTALVNLSNTNDKLGKMLIASGKDFSETVNTQYILDKTGKKPDAGTYTVYIASLSNKFNSTTGEFDVGTTENLKNVWAIDQDDMDDSKYVKAYATVSVALKQPFIQITKAPEVLVQGEKLVIEGTAEGEPNLVQFYIFGTNYFNFATEAVTDGTFTIEVEKEYTKKEYMAAGQYFLVIQHPMYDKKFNIGAYTNETPIANGTTIFVTYGDVILNKNGAWNEERAGTILFNTNNRQSANAAQALCDALDSQDIDDMYAKASFIVAGPTSYIDAIPSQITKGQVLTISGTTTGHKDDVVTVEILSTAFAAMPKEVVGSASFVALTTKIGDDGVWSISFDTSNLNADEYTCSVAVGQLDATSSKITIVEGTKPQPTQTAGPGPVTPTAQPTAQPTQTPATPGFGALAALAGLGAVAVLLLRRQ